MRVIVFIVLCLSISGCNSVYMKPGTLDKSEMVYAPRAGFSMARSIKQTLEERGYNVNVGTLVRVSESNDNETYSVPKSAKYAIKVTERREFLRPIWCVFNGFWWWNFNVSITDRLNGNEILSWRGRGCANSSLRKLNAFLDELEMKTPGTEQKTTAKKAQKQKKQGNELLILAK